MLRVALTVLTLCIVRTAQAEGTLAGLPWSYTGPRDKEATARRVVETLRRLCPRINLALPDIASFEAEFRRLPSFHTRYREGYRVIVEGGPVLANRPAQVMPSPPFDRKRPGKTAGISGVTRLINVCFGDSHLQTGQSFELHHLLEDLDRGQHWISTNLSQSKVQYHFLPCAYTGKDLRAAVAERRIEGLSRDRQPLSGC